MSDQTDTIVKLIESFGLRKEEATIYHSLTQNGVSTALFLSRSNHMGRTKVYRILDTLIAKGFVTQEVESRGFVFRANSADVFESMLSQKRKELASLEAILPEIKNALATSNVDNSNKRVVYYKGVEGLKQVTWNSLRAKGRLYIYEMVSDMSKYLDRTFSEEVRSEIVKRKIHIKQITNLTDIPAHTDVSELVTNYWEVRYVDPKSLALSYEVLVYDDVVAMYNVRGNDVFCVEIQDKDLAKMQKQLFMFVWNSSQRMRILDKKGTAVLT